MSSNAFARWGTFDDAEYEIQSDNMTYDVHADGSYDEVDEIEYKLLKDEARRQVGTQHYTYNTGYESFEVLEAKTDYFGKSYPVPAKNIEDRPVASNTLGFDRLNQVLVAFPHLDLGAVLHLKTRRRVKKTPIEGFFSMGFSYGLHGFERAGSVKIVSDMPLFLRSNDPGDYLKITEGRSGKRYTIEIRQVKPAFFSAMEEQSVFLSRTSFPWVDVGNRKTWSEMAAPLLPKYEKVISQPLPAAYLPILEEASKKKTTTEKINAVTSALETLITYKGDWKTIAGKYIPRDLHVVADARLGDCKDFAAATAAILKKLGMDAHLALVKRGGAPDEREDDLPALLDFNHAIVAVKEGDKVIWVDPTNSTSYAQGIYADIADRRALVLASPEARPMRIPPVDPRETKIRISQLEEISDSDTGSSKHVNASLTLSGNYAVSMTGATLRSSKKAVDYSLRWFFGDEKNMTNWKADDFNLDSRVVTDLMFHVDYTESNSALHTSAGPGFYLPNLGDSAVVKVDGRETDLYLGMPAGYDREIRFENIETVGNRALDCAVETPWLSASRRVTSERGGITVKDSYVVTANRIPVADLRAAKYQQMKERMEQCLEKVAVIYTPRKGVFRALSSGKSSLWDWLTSLLR